MFTNALQVFGSIVLFVLAYIVVDAFFKALRRNKAIKTEGDVEPAHLEVIPKQRPPAPPEPIKEASERLEMLEWESYNPKIHSEFVVIFGGDKRSHAMLTKRESLNKYGTTLDKTTVGDLIDLPKFKHPDLFDFLDEFNDLSPARTIGAISFGLCGEYSLSGRERSSLFSDIIDIVYSHLDTIDVEYGPGFDKDKIREFIKTFDLKIDPIKVDLSIEPWFIETIIRYYLYENILDRNIAVLENLKEKQRKARRVVTDKARARAIKNRYRDPRVRLQQPPVLFEGKRK